MHYFQLLHLGVQGFLFSCRSSVSWSIIQNWNLKSGTDATTCWVCWQKASVSSMFWSVWNRGQQVFVFSCEASDLFHMLALNLSAFRSSGQLIFPPAWLCSSAAILGPIFSSPKQFIWWTSALPQSAVLISVLIFICSLQQGTAGWGGCFSATKPCASLLMMSCIVHLLKLWPLFFCIQDGLTQTLYKGFPIHTSLLTIFQQCCLWWFYVYEKLYLRILYYTFRHYFKYYMFKYIYRYFTLYVHSGFFP